MEDAGRAIKRVREELAKKDKANGTSVSESLDLANLVKKIDRGFFDAPADVLGSIKASWAKAHADAAAHPPSSRGTRQTRNPESDLANAMLHVQQCWLEEGLKGTVLDEADFAMHASKINFIAVKTALNAAGNWSQRNVWDGFLPRLKSIKEDVALKTEGPYRTYAQLIRSLETIVTDCKAEVLDARRAGRSAPDPEEMDEAAGFVKDLERWVWGKWSENTLPRYDVDGRGDGDVGSPGAGGRRSRGVKRYAEEDSDGSFDSDSDDGDGDEKSDDGDTGRDRPRENEPVVKKRRGRPPKSSYASPGPAGPAKPGASAPATPTRSLPPGATQSPTDTDVVVVTVACHGLRATVELVRPRVPREKTEGADDAGREGAMKATKAPRSESPRPPTGPPCGARVLAVAGVAINADTDLTLASPAAFEAHARTIAGETAAADGGGGGEDPTARDAIPPPRTDSTDAADGDDSKFRECARVIEREGVDVPLVEYEAKLAAAPFPAPAALPKSPKDSKVFPAIVGYSTDRGKDARDQLAAARKRARAPAGTIRAAELRAKLKDLRGKIQDVRRDVAASGEDCGRFGVAGSATRRSSAATNSTGGGGSEYVGYNVRVDEAMVLGGRWANAVG